MYSNIVSCKIQGSTTAATHASNKVPSKWQNLLDVVELGTQQIMEMDALYETETHWIRGKILRNTHFMLTEWIAKDQ